MSSMKKDKKKKAREKHGWAPKLKSPTINQISKPSRLFSKGSYWPLEKAHGSLSLLPFNQRISTVDSTNNKRSIFTPTKISLPASLLLSIN